MAGEILITGAGGFLGGTMTEHLLGAGERVIGTDQKIDTEMAKKLKLRRLDTGDKEEVSRTIRDYLPEIIFHFAGISMPKEVAQNEALGRKVNIESVMNLVDGVESAIQIKKHYSPIVVVAGTVEQIGDPKFGGEIMTEESERNPINPYGHQKQLMAVEFLQRCHHLGIRGYVMIEGQASGVSPSGEISQRKGFFIPDIASQVAEIEASGRDQGIIVTREIGQKRNIIDVNDAMRVWIKIAQTAPEIGEYLVCANKSRTLQEVLDILINSSTVKLVHEIDRSRGAGGPNRFYSANKIKKATGWNPEIELETTIKKVLEFQRLYGKGNV